MTKFLQNRTKLIGLGFLTFALVLTGITTQPVLARTKKEVAPSLAYRAFTNSSYWNAELPQDAPVANGSTQDQIIENLLTDNMNPFIRLSGVTADGKWGRPIYFSSMSDPVYSVVCASCTTNTKQALQAGVHIPATANPDPSADSELTLYDIPGNRVFGFSKATKTTSGWSINNASMHILTSNGLDRTWTQMPDANPLNQGHRGAPASAIGVRADEIEAGAINHKLIISVNNTKKTHVFPYVGDETGTGVIPEGTLIRIKPGVNLNNKPLSPSARIIATALQKYGAVVGDQSGGGANLKVENTVAEGKGQYWTGKLSVDSLSSITFNEFEVMQLGYGCVSGGNVSCQEVD